MVKMVNYNHKRTEALLSTLQNPHSIKPFIHLFTKMPVLNHTLVPSVREELKNLVKKEGKRGSKRAFKGKEVVRLQRNLVVLTLSAMAS